MRTCSLCLVPMLRGYSAETIEKYVQDVRALATSLGGRRLWNTSSLEIYRLIQSKKILHGFKIWFIPMSGNLDLAKKLR